MLRLTPPHHQLLEQAAQLDVHIGGSESNTAVGLARLGLSVCWLSRLPANPIGRMIANEIGRYGVDTGHVVWTDAGRAGLYFLEDGLEPRGRQVLYDRADSATSHMQPADLPTDLFQPDSARLFHTTGIMPGISPSAADTARHAVQLAKQAGWQVSFDVNYRAKLWDTEAARNTCEPLMQAADIIFIAQVDAQRLYAVSDDAEIALSQLTARFPQATLVMTLGAKGAAASSATGDNAYQPVFPAATIGRVGGGDAFSAGFLFAHLHLPAHTPDRLALCLKYGAAAAALKYSIPGDMPLIDRQSVLRLVNPGEGYSGIVR